MNYDDMMGLGGMDGILSPEIVKDHLTGAFSGAGALMLASWIVPKIPTPAAWTPENTVRLKAGIGALLGLVAGRSLYDYNRDASMAVTGAVAGTGLAQFIASYFDAIPVRGFAALPEELALSGAMSDEALFASYGGGGMNALAALEATNVQAARGAFAGPTVTPEALYGLGAPVVQMETLGAYSPYMA